MDDAGRYGLVFLAKTAPVTTMPVKFRVLNAPLIEKGKTYDMTFKLAGSFSKGEYAYHSYISNYQLAEIRAHRFLQFTAVYTSTKASSPPMQMVGIVSPIAFTVEANEMLDRCEVSLKG